MTSRGRISDRAAGADPAEFVLTVSTVGVPSLVWRLASLTSLTIHPPLLGGEDLTRLTNPGRLRFCAARSGVDLAHALAAMVAPASLQTLLLDNSGMRKTPSERRVAAAAHPQPAGQPVSQSSASAVKLAGRCSLTLSLLCLTSRHR